MKNKKLINITVFTASSSAINSIFRFLLTILLGHNLTAENFGLWASLTSVAALLMVGDFGVGNALRNKVSELITKEGENSETQRQYFYVAIYSFIALSAVLIVTLFFSYDYLPLDSLFKTESHEVKAQGKDLAFYIVIVYLLGLPLAIPNALFHSYNESVIASLINLLSGMLGFAVIFLLIFSGRSGVNVLTKSYFATQLIVGAFGFYYFIHRRGWGNSFVVNVRGGAAKLFEMMKSGIMFMANDISIGFLLNSPTIIVAAVVDLRTAATYNISQKIFSFFALIIQSAMNPIWGRLAFLKHNGKFSEVVQLCQKTSLVITIIFIPIILFTSINVDWIFELIGGSQYKPDAVLVGLIGFSFLAYAIYDTFSLIHKSFGDLRYRLVLQIITSICVGYLLKLSYGYVGVIGIPVAFSTTWVLLAIILYFHGKKIVEKWIVARS